ncbi:MAG TPA: UDP-3-O-(3-hydroxymyristoyl)glucosamine N-acyltransferase [Thermoanaerobaculia bacterium]|nr:UDP-3-O-(3-hydroxymyristoyl)glucosamine N-acyltransferase [Thermoanaerobaculia bacterium]
MTRTWRLAELAERAGGEVRGDGDRPIAGIRALPDAGPEHLSLLTAARHRAAARDSRAGALLVAPGAEGWLTGGLEDRDLLVAAHPTLALTRLLPLFHPPERPAAGVHATAVVGEGCAIDPSAHVGPYAVIGDGSRLGAGAVVGALAVVGRRCVVGEGARLHPHVVLYDDCEVGPRAELHSGVVLGADGFGYAHAGGVHHKVPQVGRAVVEADVEVGANSTIDRGALGETRIGAGSKIDNLVQVGHNVRVGRSAILCGQSGVAGSTVLGDGVVLAGQAGVGGHLEVGDRVTVAASSALLQPVPPGSTVAGTPAMEIGAWRRQVVTLGRLEEMRRRLASLEKRLAAMEAAGPDPAGD